MIPPTRSSSSAPQVLKGAALLGLGVFTACGRKESQQAAPSFIAPGIAATSVPALPEPTTDQPGLPRIRVQTDDLVTTGTAGHQATVFGDSGLQYEWFIQGGSFEGDTHGSSVSWTAGAPGEVRLFCQGTNSVGKKSVALMRVQSEALPTIERFEARPPVISVGRSARLSWNATEIKTLVLDPGGQDVARISGPGLEVKPQATTVYSLKASNAAGASVTRTLELKVVPPPTISALRAEGAINYGQSLTVVGEFSGGKGTLSQGGTVLASGATSPLRTQVPALQSGASFLLTVTNEAGDSVTRTLNFTPPTPAAAPAK